MASIIHYDDVTLDTETGEVIESLAGVSVKPLLVQRLYEASQQAKEWEAARRGLSASLVWRLDDRREVFEDLGLYASLRSSVRSTQDMDSLREQLETLELTRDELLELCLAATGFSLGLLSSSALQELVSAYTSQKTSAPYVVTGTLRKPAPKRTEREDA